ncbi:MAG: hypothetical protein V1914_02160 [archaeon]
MKYQAQSVLIGRKKSTEKDYNLRPCFISLFDENNPHLSIEGPKEVLEFEDVHKIVIQGLSVNYLLPGNDLVINNIKEFEVEQDGPHITVTGTHI